MQFLENLWKIWENIEILNMSERRRNYLGSEPNYHTAEFFTENLLVIEMKKTGTYESACLFRTFNSIDMIV